MVAVRQTFALKAHGKTPLEIFAGQAEELEEGRAEQVGPLHHKQTLPRLYMRLQSDCWTSGPPQQSTNLGAESLLFRMKIALVLGQKRLVILRPREVRH